MHDTDTGRGLPAALAVMGLAILFVGLLVWGISAAWPQEWHSTNQLTMGWDAPATLVNGDPIPAGDTVEYDVFTADEAKTNIVQANTSGRLTNTEFTFTFTVEGKYVLGVQAFRLDSDGQELGFSTVAWSDDPSAATNPFGAAFYITIDAAGNLRIVQE